MEAASRRQTDLQRLRGRQLSTHLSTLLHQCCDLPLVLRVELCELLVLACLRGHRLVPALVAEFEPDACPLLADALSRLNAPNAPQTLRLQLVGAVCRLGGLQVSRGPGLPAPAARLRNLAALRLLVEAFSLSSAPEYRSLLLRTLVSLLRLALRDAPYVWLRSEPPQPLAALLDRSAFDQLSLEERQLILGLLDQLLDEQGHAMLSDEELQKYALLLQGTRYSTLLEVSRRMVRTPGALDSPYTLSDHSTHADPATGTWRAAK
jgi:hypothetical protein